MTDMANQSNLYTEPKSLFQSETFAVGLFVAGAILLLTCLSLFFTSFRDVPEFLVLPVVDWINSAMNTIVEPLQPFFRAISNVLAVPMNGLQSLLSIAPWVTIAAAFVGLAWLAQGWKLALFAVLGILTTLALGFWQQTMNTLALIGVSVPLSIALGFGLGAASYLVPRIRRPMDLALALMQTVPAFAYLIPILLLFGFGPVVGLIASAIYAAPPMVRNTMLGLTRVPDAQIESGQMAGCTGRQLFWNVRVPGAMPQILVGVNQSTMQALSMVIIAAIIGGFDDVGWAVLTALRKAQFGQSLMAGLVIVFLAILIDRITWGFAENARNHRGHHGAPFWHRPSVRCAMVVIATLPVGLIVPGLDDGPRSPLLNVVEPLNSWLENFLFTFGPTLTTLKTNVFYFFMFPLRAGLEQAVTPFTWGFALSSEIIVGYWSVVAALAGIAVVRKSYVVAGAILFTGWISYFGMTGVSWVALSVFLVALGHSLGGLRTALFCFSACVFIVVTGLWDLAMLSLYLCGAAVAISFVLGGAIGMLAAHSTRLSGIVRVVADTLQTMPQFVLLIPFLMFFQVGEFTALLAIIIYAIVPAMRYVEQGLRTIDEEILEASRQMGCTNLQILWQVRIPLAMPVLALGVNQTIMFGLAMLAITALVGTQDLGQEVYVALSQADAGRGLLAGLAIAIIALLSDRLIRDWINVLSKRRHLSAPSSSMAAAPPV
ncbi:ABC transporter permease subunit [Pseudohalocynthiibacter aestuariivivens]|nr:ABC transporter permease subunit [Pseudohalocynthiibacter aestuariivivens]QIE45203.1 ABC transporter permease subunit [Pseudohalocynthiibacter aestuariivivens]